MIRSAKLLGEHHHEIGALASVAEGPAAVALCRGGAAKTYAHTEPNEDAALFAFSASGILVAVADGHHGSSGSRAVIEWLEAEVAPRWLSHDDAIADADRFAGAALDVLSDCNHAVLRHAAQRDLPPAPTTLSLALVRPAEDFLGHASAGDSHVFTVEADRGEDVAWASTGESRCYFLGYAAEAREALAGKSLIGSTTLSGLDAVLLATDGLSTPGIGVADPPAAAAEAVRAAERDAPFDRRPLDACKHLAQAAMRAQREQRAGDNIGCAVVWLRQR